MSRILISLALAAATTFGLLFIMHTLIEMDKREPKEEDDTKIADIFMSDDSIETKYDVVKPKKMDDPEEPPPEMPEPEFDTPDINPDALNMTAPKVGNDIKGAGIGGLSADGEYLPIVKVAPRYPQRALSRGYEGWVIIEYTVTTNGSVRDAFVVDGWNSTTEKPTTWFNRAALKAAEKYKYKPRVIEGTPVEVPGVQTKITFKLAGE